MTTTLYRLSILLLAATCVVCHYLGIPDEPIHQLLVATVSHEHLVRGV